MRIAIIDWPPWVGATRRTRFVQKNFRTFPKFADIESFASATSRERVNILEESIRRFTNEIYRWVADNHSWLFFDWSPFSYNAVLALEWNKPNMKIKHDLNTLWNAIKDCTNIVLLHSSLSEEAQIRTGTKVIRYGDVGKYERSLVKIYTERWFDIVHQ